MFQAHIFHNIINYIFSNILFCSVSLFHKDDIFLLLLLSISAHRHLIDDYVPCMRGWGKTIF
jgi:hypothetical protein